VRAVDCFLEKLYPAEPKRRQWDDIGALHGVELVEHDLRDGVPLELMSSVDAIVNEAGMAGLMNSWEDFHTYSSCNISVVEKLAQAAHQHGIQKFVQISTSSVYGENALGDESTRPMPISPYGVTKLAAEELLRAFGRSRGLPHTILRYYSVFGPGQRPDMAYHKIIKAALQGHPIEIYGDGEQSRTNTFVGDCARATVAAASRPSTGEIFNISGSERITLNDAISVIERAVGRPATRVPQPPRAGDQRHTEGDATMAQNILGLQQTKSFSEVIQSQVEWQRKIYPH
jgi:UDP-glucuronate 4-epimerase